MSKKNTGGMFSKLINPDTAKPKRVSTGKEEEALKAPQKKEKRSPPLAEPVKQKRDTNQETKNETMMPRHPDTTVSRYHDTTHDTIIEMVRKATRQLGKEAATYRFTQEEKKALNDIVYTYRTQFNIKTSSNELTRIAINHLFEDYRLHGQESILAQVVARLNS